MISLEVRAMVEELLDEYARVMDDDRLEEWPGLFTKDGLYRIVPRENEAQGLPLAIVSCDSADALVDRVAAHRKANLFAPHIYRHLLGHIRMSETQPGEFAARLNYAVFRTSLDPTSYGTSALFSVGEYKDRIVVTEGRALFKEKIVIVDTSRIQSLLVTPL